VSDDERASLPLVETSRQMRLETRFEVQQIACDGILTLVLVGELDLGSRPVLEACLAEAPESETSTVVLDLRKLTLIGSAGVGALLHAVRQCAENGVELLVVPGQGAARRALELAGVLDQLQT
jgi:anti-sigma B factor antagonist